jgi:anti-sigma regulatory factor (Ser/Thr protein kinase)/DNA-binding NarL/FixJ family response regulator
MARILMVAPDEGLLVPLRASPLLEAHTIDEAAGDIDALRRLRRRAYDVLVTCPFTTVEEDLALLSEVRAVRPGVRAILLAPRTTPEEVIQALRSQAFACFSAPFDVAELADMVARGAEGGPWQEGIAVVSAKPDWITVRVNCRLLSAERLINFFSELRRDVAEAARDDFMFAFREVLVNAMEHGGGFDPDQSVEVSAVRTARTLVFYLRDPGPGFSLSDLPHASVATPDDPLAHARVRLEAGLRPGGFGLLLARNVVDEMIHSEKANEVLLIKHLE